MGLTHVTKNVVLNEWSFSAVLEMSALKNAVLNLSATKHAVLLT